MSSKTMTLSPATSSQSSSKPQSDPARAWATAVFTVCCRSDRAFLSPEKYDILGLTISKLDLATGRSSDQGPRFLVPLSSQQMEQHLDRESKWAMEEEDIFSPDKDAPDDSDNHPDEDVRILRIADKISNKAYDMLFVIKEFASIPYGNCINPVWSARCTPESWQLEPKYRSRRAPRGHPWVCSSVWVAFDPTLSPHFIGFVFDAVSFDESSRLRPCELAVAARLLRQRLWVDALDKLDGRYPVATVCSLAGRKLRILQAWQDRRSPSPRSINLRMSDVLDFTQGIAKGCGGHDDWIKALCFLLATPVVEE